MPITFNIKNWQAWTPSLSSHQDWQQWAQKPFSLALNASAEHKPDVAEIPPMLRRRLSSQGKAALSVMIPLHKQYGPMPIVYVSRHGEVGRTLKMLNDLANKELLSPTQFSLSVHNATAGLFSIQLGVKTNISAIAAGSDDVIPALLEAIGQLSETVDNVLVVFCDEPVPDIYCHQVEHPATPFAAAFVIGQGKEISLNIRPKTPTDKAVHPQALSLVAFMAAAKNQLNLPCNGSNWALERQNP